MGLFGGKKKEDSKEMVEDVLLESMRQVSM